MKEHHSLIVDFSGISSPPDLVTQEMLGFNVTYSEGPGTVEGASGVRGWAWGGCGKAPRQATLAVGDIT